MAKGGDKRRLEENAAHLKKLRLLIAGANAAFIVVRLLLKRSTAGKLLWTSWLLSTVADAACYRFISSALSPTYSDNGELAFSGQDLKVGGVLSYFHDILYIASFAQLAGCLTDWAWAACLLVPAYAAYQLAVNVLIPYWKQPRVSEAAETEAERKRREKRERQEARAAKFAGRR